ncbi:MAG: ABC transporter ATP-binding protein [Rhodobacteraceae bacterium]|nr:ABC transporter ATP-binding protein [Paracoccaceae bacterium]
MAVFSTRPQPALPFNGPVSHKNQFETRLRVQNLSVGYDQEEIVKGVDFFAIKGGITVLVGPNGCGKSTLLKAMARILTPMAGQVLIDNELLHGLPTKEVALRLALLPQGPIAPEGLSVQELVSQGRFPHQSLFRQWSPEDSRAVSEAMKATNIVEFANRPLASLSGGQRQRCWIAMVLAQETPIILLDEPTTFLDLKVQVDVMNVLRKVAKSGRTLVVVMHELNIAAAIADHLVMMRDGRIVASGTPHETMTRDRLKQVFGLDAQVIPDPQTGRPICVPRLSESL